MYMSIETSVTMDRLTKSLLKSLLHPYTLYLFDKITHKYKCLKITFIK